jgi:tRNA nucleotidyltransferase (CCA-adding enzyme)
MQVYLVGGAVRDELLGRPVLERDWVVVGATPAEMERAGYRAVGREFPVFLHPVTKEEYALARQERKTGPGYRGFSVHFSPDVTLEQDLQRRDLTINAMARGDDGVLVDPYGGNRDLEQRWLRHVSTAFVEDPVRVLRVARFAARFAAQGFRLAPETAQLLGEMVRNGEVNALVPERVWREMQRALTEANPESFFDVLQGCGALKVIIPELSWSDSDREALTRVVPLSADGSVRFAALMAGIDHHVIHALCERLRVPADYRDLARLASRFATRLAMGLGATPAKNLLDVFEKSDALRRPERFEKLLLATRSRVSVEATIPAALAAVTPVRLTGEQLATLNGPDIAIALHTARLQRLESLYQGSALSQ